MYILVCKDLPRTVQLVQACHAAAQAGIDLIPSEIEHPHFVVCGVISERLLVDQFNRLNTPKVLFREPDLGNRATAAVFGPIFGEERKLFRRFQILKDHHHSQEVSNAI